MAKQQQPDPAAAQVPGPDAEPSAFLTLTREGLVDLLREVRRDPVRDAKDAAETQRIKVRRDQMVRIARQDEASKKARQDNCTHRKPNGEEASGGQEFSDGRVRRFCLRCQKILREYWAPSVAQGMAIQSKMEQLGITDDDVRAHMDFRGVGDAAQDQPDDFALAFPRGVMNPDLTTENR